MIDKTKRFLLNFSSYYILEPRFQSGKWRIKDTSLLSLRKDLSSLYDVYNEMKSFFDRVNMCPKCSGWCCHGNYNRFTIFDHIAHQIAGMKDRPKWGYLLRPVGSYLFNRVDSGTPPCLAEGKGCIYEYCFRPAICIWWICGDMEKVFTNEQKLFIGSRRKKIENIYRKFAFKLLFGGMEKVSCSK
ncbi:MAG: hypothetical protein HQ579_08980 [Candidatus Omnitrophica bacterium]|nr:hypothetical protein [Candidatus Omnitrophota bacterium]